MGTKANPGEFDCYAKLADDEPFFTLRAKDPIAPDLVRAWRAIRAGDRRTALMHLCDAQDEWQKQIENGARTLLDYDSEKSGEAATVAHQMEQWQLLRWSKQVVGLNEEESE